MVWVGWIKRKIGLSLNEKCSAVDGVMVSLSILIVISRLYSFERIPDVLHSIIASLLKLKQIIKHEYNTIIIGMSLNVSLKKVLNV